MFRASRELRVPEINRGVRIAAPENVNTEKNERGVIKGKGQDLMNDKRIKKHVSKGI